jgi:hypothetical protein
MPVPIPSLSVLYQQAIEDIKSKLGIISLLGRTVLSPIAAVWAGNQKNIYSAIYQVNLNFNPSTADYDSLIQTGLERLGRVPNLAIDGQYVCTVTGSIGATITASSTFTSSKNNIYILDSDYTLSSTTDQITLRSISESDNTALDIGDVLSSTKPLIDIDTNVVVESESIAQTNAESIEE